MKFDWSFFFRVGVTVFLLYLLTYYWHGVSAFIGGLLSAAGPLILGFFAAYLVNILMSWFERLYFPHSTKSGVIASRRPVCLLLALAAIALILWWLVQMILPELVSCIQVLSQEVPPLLSQLYTWLDQEFDIANFFSFQAQNLDWEDIVRRVLSWLQNSFAGAMTSVIALVTTTFSALIAMLVALIFSLYLLAGKERLLAQIDRVARTYLKPNWYRQSKSVLMVFHDSFHRFIVGQCIEAVILGLLCMAGMHLFGFPYANMVGSLIGFTALIPIAGAYIGAGVGAFMIFTVSPLRSLLFLVFIVILQQLEGNLIYPRVVGASIGLPGVWVLAAITIGGGLLGVVGMLLGVPLAAALYRLLRTDLSHRETIQAPPAPSH